MRGLANEERGLVDLLQTKVGSTLEEHEDAVGAIDGGLEKGRRNCRLDRTQSAIFAGCRTDTHKGRTGVLHHGLNVVEVNVDQARGRDQFGDALDA